MLPGVAAGDPRSVHRARVASRRLREILPLLQLEGHLAHKLGKRLRKVTRRLAPTRELDVLLTLLDTDLAAGAPQVQSRLRTELGAKREQARARLVAKPVVNDLRRIGRKLETVGSKLAADEDRASRATEREWRWAVEARVAHRAGALKKALEEAGSVYLAERLHEVRLCLKKLRYGLEVAVESEGLRNHPDLRKLKQVQRVLGQMHDLQVLVDHARHAQAVAPSGRGSGAGSLARFSAWRELDGLIRSLENECRRLHARFMREREGLLALCDRLRTAPARGSARPGRRPVSARRAG